MISQSRDCSVYHPSVVVSDDSGSRSPLSTNSVQGRGYPILRMRCEDGSLPAGKQVASHTLYEGVVRYGILD